jgi:hypothetical protein
MSRSVVDDDHLSASFIGLHDAIDIKLWENCSSIQFVKPSLKLLLPAIQLRTPHSFS